MEFDLNREKIRRNAAAQNTRIRVYHGRIYHVAGVGDANAFLTGALLQDAAGQPSRPSRRRGAAGTLGGQYWHTVVARRHLPPRASMATLKT